MADSKKYDGSQWEHSLRKLTTATEAVENPLYSDGTAITSYTIKGNEEHTGTPMPSAPISVNGVGELETSGEHAGEYKIPISNGQQTTPIYLGSVESYREIKRIVYTGAADETWTIVNEGTANAYVINTGNPNAVQGVDYLKCTHYAGGEIYNGNTYTGILVVTNGGVRIRDDNAASMSVSSFKSFLQQQYSAGTPVTVWYVLATPETAAVNQPLMKIGTYADTLSNATSIPTTEGANSITVDTTVQPSEFSATWTGWHNANVKEWDGSDWQ